MIALGIGEVVLDKTMLLEGFPEEGSKTVPVKQEASIGGPVAAGLILLAKLGVECYFVASVGSDEAGDLLKRKLRKFGVKLLPNIVKKTKVHTVLVNNLNGSRTIIKDNPQREKINTVSMHLVQSADIIIFDRHEPEAFKDVMFKKRPGTKIVVDPSDEVSQKTIEMLKQATFPILPIEALTKFRRHEGLHENLEAVYEITGKPFVVTWGGNGSLYYEAGRMDFFPAYELPVVDTLGAGDIFRGAFAYGLLNDWEVPKTIDYANLVAGLQCTRLGNSSAIPDQDLISLQQSTALKKELTLTLLMENFII